MGKIKDEEDVAASTMSLPDAAQLSKEDLEQAEFLKERFRSLDPKLVNRQKAVRRQNQKQLSDQLSADYVEPERLKEHVQEATESYEKCQLGGMSGKDLRTDARIVHQMQNQLMRQVDAACAAVMKKSYDHKHFFQRLKLATWNTPKQTAPFKGHPLFDISDELPIEIKGNGEDAMKGPLNGECWSALASKAFDVPVSTLGTSYLLPILNFGADTGPEQKKVRRARVKEEKEEEVLLVQKISDDLAEDEQTVCKELDYVRKNLRRALKKHGGCVNYYKFVIDPNSYGQSVENMFHTSFLVKDAHVLFGFDDDDAPTLYELKEEEKEQMRQPDRASFQAIVKLDFELWEGFKTYLDITQPMIPPREPSK